MELFQLHFSSFFRFMAAYLLCLTHLVTAPDLCGVYNAWRVSLLHPQRPVQSSLCAVHKFLSHDPSFVSVPLNPNTPARCALYVLSAPSHSLRISLCRGNSCTAPVRFGKSSSRHGQLWCDAERLREDRYRCHSQGRRCIPTAYIYLARPCILCRAESELYRLLWFSLQSMASYSRHPLLQTVPCACALLRHTAYPMLRCRVHCPWLPQRLRNL